MTRIRRIGAAVTLAGTLAIGLAIAMPAAASTGTRPMVVATATVGDLCEALADAIAFLEGRPPSRLRDFLLAQAQELFNRYC